MPARTLSPYTVPIQNSLSLIHSLTAQDTLPERMNNPFSYTPHPLCKAAAKEVQKAIEAREEWQEEVSRGKMFGVLVVKTPEGKLGYLAAYSGQIGGRSDWEGFVPAVFDYLDPNGYFKIHEAEISNINKLVAKEENDEQLVAERLRLKELEQLAKKEIERYQDECKRAKKHRDALRKSINLDEATREQLVAESQFMKAELKRKKIFFARQTEAHRKRIEELSRQLHQHKQQRRTLSDQLQQWLFNHFIFYNQKGDKANLNDIFKHTPSNVPPSGAGECCAPKLLQYAFRHHLSPVCMAEFWWGASPKGEIRHHLHYYPACHGKCRPILAFMLKGMDMDSENHCLQKKAIPKIIYEDDDLIVVDKPYGMLSVPGNIQAQSVWDFLTTTHNPSIGWKMVHRLDMATSGLLVVAKSKEAHRILQAQFADRKVKKRYIAIVEGTGLAASGTINLPLIPDLNDRPRQKVDLVYGKQAITSYKVLESKDGKTRIALYPHTGRTHQLRVHCAHPKGLNAPILGDPLYGRGEQQGRLFLHAEFIQFLHPTTGRTTAFESKAAF